MKTIIIKSVFLILLIFSIVLNSNSQIVKTLSDLKILDSIKDEYNGKPLKFLLKDIQLEIKAVICDPLAFESPAYFSFYFIDIDSLRHQFNNHKKPYSVHVYFNKSIPKWHLERKGKTWNEWTKKDEEEYGDLSILAIRVEPTDKKPEITLNPKI